jgi:hypothetical protein
MFDTQKKKANRNPAIAIAVACCSPFSPETVLRVSFFFLCRRERAPYVPMRPGIVNHGQIFPIAHPLSDILAVFSFVSKPPALQM